MSNSSEPVVDTQSGKVAGERRGAHSAFRGIPYASPPVGALRFRAPEPVEPWSGVRAAKAFGPSAPQGAVFAPGVVAEGPTSEDCLYLNVYTPAPDGKKRPVMFWVHGGAFTVGSAAAPLYDGAKLAERHDVVVVTINYRVGALGYLSLGEQGRAWGAADNRGQLDQIAALRWVRDNIERFGGDPGNVTLFGESAGGTAVCLLLVTPSARGLFQRAIAQSSVGSLQLPTSEQLAPRTASLLASLELAPSHSERLLDVPLETLMRAQASLESDARSWPHFVPVLDRALFEDTQPRALIEQGRGSTVPLIIGTNRDEWNLFALMSLPDWEKPLEDAELLARITRKLPASAAGAAPGLLATYRASRRERGLPYGNRALLRALEGDLRFRIPSIRFAEAYLQRTPETYLYLFTYESPALRGALGACHGLELPFVFGTYDGPNQERFAGEGDTVVGLSEAIRARWTAFARTGSPATGEARWDAYEVERRATLELGPEVRLVDDAYGDERRAWDAVL
jgi:para-nitrobenzyl esterase